MTIINVMVDDQRLEFSSMPVVASEGVKETYVKFALSSDWSGFGATALFYRDDSPEDVYTSVLDGAGLAEVPYEITAAPGWIRFGLSGSDGTSVHTSEILKYKIVKGKYTSGQSSEPPAPGIYEQMLAIAGQMRDTLNAAVIEQNAIIQGLVTDMDDLRSDMETEQTTFESVVTGQINTLVNNFAGSSRETILFEGSHAVNIGDEIDLVSDPTVYDYLDIVLNDGLIGTIIGPTQNSQWRVTGETVKSTGASVTTYVIEGVLDAQSLCLRVSTACAIVDTGTASTRYDLGSGPIADESLRRYCLKVIGRKLTDDAEVLNIRVGADGVTYQTAGTAVRTQLDKKLNAPISGGTVDYGTSGQLLATDGQGNTEWVDSVIPDGSITVAKLAPGVIDTTYLIQGAAAESVTVGQSLASKASAADVTALDTRVTAVEGALEDKADADDVGELSQLTTTAKDNMVSAINEANEAVTGINGRLDRQQAFIHSSADEITSVTDKKIVIADGKITFVENPNNYWKTIVVPVKCVYIDGVATLKSGGLSGNESVGVPAMVFVDDNYNVVGTPVYTSLSAPKTFSEADVPAGATYLVGCYSQNFVFAFKSVDSQVKENESKIDGINNTLFVAGEAKVETAFVDTTGFYNRTGGFETYSGIKTSTITVDPGEVFSLTSKNYYSMARAVFFDANSTFVSAVYSASNTSLVENTKIVVPQNAVTMLIQAYDTTAVRLYKVDLSEKLTVLSNEVEAVTDAATIQSGTPVTLTYEDATGYYNKNKGFATYSGVTVAKVTVTEGQKYLLTTRNYYDVAIALFLDSNESIVRTFWVANSTSEVQNYEILIPGGVATLMIQRLYKYIPTTLTLVTGVSSKPVKSILEGKRITLIGDSITESNATALTNWAYWIKDWANPTIQNLGASGTGFIAGGSNPYSNRVSRISNPDIIGVALSFNDMSQTIEDLTTAAETFFDDLITAYPTIPVICYVQSPWSAYHPGVEKSDQWVAAMRNICAVRGIPFYDGMYYGSALRPWNAANRALYYMHDGEGSDGAEDWVHPNSEGHKIIARRLYPHFADNVVATGLDYLI